MTRWAIQERVREGVRELRKEREDGYTPVSVLFIIWTRVFFKCIPTVYIELIKAREEREQ